jgi:hypothetical protein
MVLRFGSTVIELSPRIRTFDDEHSKSLKELKGAVMAAGAYPYE